ncbi:RRN3 [Candida pseudojiufengensis]|uniref:RRN3 n=1 Tax=Candida pseudojiufengensis TaxID=497109 RepID=UPI00222490FC|nr:RRN3 [Candida pseudojiufengensis]KAI5960631.1 RRN3 [Candida pseudojiufengensis]
MIETRKRNGMESDQISKRMKGEEEELHHQQQQLYQNEFTEKMYISYVKSAFGSLEKGDSLQIDTLTDRINQKEITLSHFSIILKGLINNTSKLDNKSCNNLIFAILKFNWLSNESDLTFIDLYSHFLIVLVSTLPKFLNEVLNKIISDFENFINPKSHEIIRKILRYIPTSINQIPQILQNNFPHHISSTTDEIINYVTNLINILNYAPELQFSIWQLVIECCIKLDVELQNELDDLDDDEIEGLVNGKDEDEELLPEEWDPTTTTRSIKNLSSKLDNIVNLLLTRTSISFTEEQLNNGNGVNLFNTINSIFKSHILPTHFTKSIQFILFHITQYQQELADSFLVLLIDVAFNPNEIIEKRLKAMQYLSSYIARAKNLSKHQIIFIVSYLMGWLNKYILEREQETLEDPSTSTLGMERFKLFYSAFQALLYIFCFRHEILKKENDKWECDLDKFFQRVIIVKFNPLKYCDETVVYIFAKLATKLNVCYCYSIIEHNKRERMLQTNGLPSSVGNFKQKQEFLDLEAYFPFDPIVLPKSKKIISKNYVEWSEVNPEEDDDESIGSGSRMDEDEEELSSDEEDDSDSDSSDDSSDDE